MAPLKASSSSLPEDPAALKALLQAALAERDQAQQRAEEQAARAAQQGKRADDLYLRICVCNSNWTVTRSGTTGRGRTA